MVYVFVTSNVMATATINEGDYTNKILWWIGFNTESQKQYINQTYINKSRH